MTRAGFVVRNKFQIHQFDRLASAYEGADFLLFNREGLEQEFSCLDFRLRPMKLFTRKDISIIASNYDILFFQTPFPGIELIDRIPLVSVQYGLAKERHNYGEWRALADLNLMYGRYSANAVSHFGPTFAVGNLKFCGWDYKIAKSRKRDAKLNLGMDPRKPSVLYMPTYGTLGSFNELVEPLASFGSSYNMIIKVHHNDETQRRWVARATKLGHRHLFAGGHDQRPLLEAADVVISDFSGAAFDAVYAEIPVILYQRGASDKVGVQKFDLSSLEYRERSRIGRVCLRADDIGNAIAEVIVSSDKFIERARDLREELFVDVSPEKSVLSATRAVDDLLTGRLAKRSTQQACVREAIVRLLHAERELASRRFGPLQRFWNIIESTRQTITGWRNRPIVGLYQSTDCPSGTPPDLPRLVPPRGLSLPPPESGPSRSTPLK